MGIAKTHLTPCVTQVVTADDTVNMGSNHIVHVTADDHRLVGVQRDQMLPESVLPGHPIGEALELILGIGGIDSDEIKILKFQNIICARIILFMVEQLLQMEFMFLLKMK